MFVEKKRCRNYKIRKPNRFVVITKLHNQLGKPKIMAEVPLTPRNPGRDVFVEKKRRWPSKIQKPNQFVVMPKLHDQLG